MMARRFPSVILLVHSHNRITQPSFIYPTPSMAPIHLEDDKQLFRSWSELCTCVSLPTSSCAYMCFKRREDAAAEEERASVAVLYMGTLA